MEKEEALNITTSSLRERDPFAGSHVPKEYQGTPTDRQDMHTLGRKQVLRRRFKFFTMLGFASTVMVAWEFVLVVSPFGLADGGKPAVFWGLLLSPIVLTPVYASLAEMASMRPTAAGQYAWVSELAPPKFQKGLSYAVGWLISLGWQTFLCGVSFQIASLVLGLAVLGNADYDMQPWHTTLLTIGITGFCTLFNVLFADRLPLVETVMLVLHVLGVFAICIPLWIMAPKSSASETIVKFTSNGGWQDLGLASTIGVVPMIGMLIGYDCCVHMSEEVQDASRTIPAVIIWAVVSNAAMLLLVGITYIFCLGDLDSVLNSDTGQPVVQVFYNATGSYTAFNAFNSLGTVSILSSYTITVGCLIWRRLFGKPLPPRRWSLGRWGLAVNMFSLCLTTPMLFFYVWPLYYPVTASNMNWSSAMLGGVTIIALVYYLVKGRHDYAGPVSFLISEE
ncbi:amino acid transporter-like protein [Hortaea werneckii]|nr:amino acid transporter-like protein [Hortaea werneckii]KAI7346611.1 amino acid transporter-like protein [Hortaea werneckii]KAI7561047.1 amino acid transporter-like protein [Hortaea werneckii]KAI7609674.1 amino acid transporter-like protein [Hortaea werneckii]KAI7625803.1 amino acid transporter-like protein [Hortaea werneckii]